MDLFIISIFLLVMAAILAVVPYSLYSRRNKRLQKIIEGLEAKNKQLRSDMKLSSDRWELLNRDSENKIRSLTARVRSLKQSYGRVSHRHKSTEQRLLLAQSKLKKIQQAMNRFKITYEKRINKERKHIELKFLKSHDSLLRTILGDIE